MKRKKFSGIIIPAVTPLTSEFKIDTGAVERMFDFFNRNAVHPFIIGTTGEGPSLSNEQKREYLKAASRAKKDEMVLYAGLSSNVVSDAVELAKICADNNVDAVAAKLPSYYQLTEGQMKNYFETLADAISLPLIIYNIPGTTHMSIPLTVIDELSHHPGIIATKDSERSEERLQESLARWKDREDFGHFLGWAAKSDNALLNGSDGLIPSTGNFMPSIYAEMLAAAESGEVTKVHEMQNLSNEFGALYQSGKTLGQSLWALKTLMKEIELCEPNVMPPLTPMDNSAKEELLNNFKLLSEKYKI